MDYLYSLLIDPHAWVALAALVTMEVVLGIDNLIFISILKARGYDNLINVSDGFKGIKASGKFALTEYVCPSTML